MPYMPLKNRILTLIVLSSAWIVSPNIYAQFVSSINVDLNTEPNTIQLIGSYDPGYISRVEIAEQAGESDSVVVHMYFQHCFAFSILYYFDTTLTTTSTLPYDLWIITYSDTTSISDNPPICIYQNEDIIARDTFFLSAEQILSTEEMGQVPEIKVYPNPVTDYLYLDVSIPWNEAIVYSHTGVEVMRLKRSDRQDHIPVGHLSSGMYMLVMRRDNGSVMGRAKFIRDL